MGVEGRSPRRSFSPFDSHSDSLRSYHFLPTQFSAILNVIKKLLDDTQYITAIEKQNSLLQQKNVLLQQNLEKVKADKVEEEDAIKMSAAPCQERPFGSPVYTNLGNLYAIREI